MLAHAVCRGQFKVVLTIVARWWAVDQCTMRQAVGMPSPAAGGPTRSPRLSLCRLLLGRLQLAFAMPWPQEGECTAYCTVTVTV